MPDGRHYCLGGSSFAAFKFHFNDVIVAQIILRPGSIHSGMEESEIIPKSTEERLRTLGFRGSKQH